MTSLSASVLFAVTFGLMSYSTAGSGGDSLASVAAADDASAATHCPHTAAASIPWA